METMQDKEIREKLNSLDTLPEGYAPSLDSKWELLRAGQPEKKKRMPYFWYAAAASLLLLLGFGFLFFKTSKPENEIAISDTNLPVSKQKTVAISPEKPETITANDAPEKIFVQPEAPVKNARPEALKTQNAARQLAKVKLINKPESPAQAHEPTFVTPEPQPVVVAAEDLKTVRKKKARFVEMDFEAPARLKPAVLQTQTAQINFKLKILPKESDPAPAVVQSEKPLRLQHTF